MLVRRDGKNCFGFSGEADFVAAIKKALTMSDQEIEKMRLAVWNYYERFLEPKAFGETLVRSEGGRVLVNAEENSVRLVFPGMVFPWEVPADTMQT